MVDISLISHAQANSATQTQNPTDSGTSANAPRPHDSQPMDPRNSNGLARNNSREVRRLQREDSNYDARLSRGSRDDRCRPNSMDMGSLSASIGGISLPEPEGLPLSDPPTSDGSLRLLPPLLGGGISAPYFQAVELKTNKSGVPSPTGPWVVGLLPLIAREFPHLLSMETVTPADLAGGADAARVGALKFRIAFRNERGTRNLSAEQERRLKELQKVDPSAVLAEPMDGARANENNAALCRLVRLILKQFGSNRQFKDWHSVRRQLTPTYWTNLGRGGNQDNDHSQTFVELQPGCFEAHCRAVLQWQWRGRGTQGVDTARHVNTAFDCWRNEFRGWIAEAPAGMDQAPSPPPPPQSYQLPLPQQAPPPSQSPPSPPSDAPPPPLTELSSRQISNGPPSLPQDFGDIDDALTAMSSLASQSSLQSMSSLTSQPSLERMSSQFNDEQIARISLPGMEDRG